MSTYYRDHGNLDMRVVHSVDARSPGANDRRRHPCRLFSHVCGEGA
jgi:hypothetical protein